MAYIELVIKIPEHYYENNIKKELPIYLSEDNIVAILPKGHGRLIDADELEIEEVDVDWLQGGSVGSIRYYSIMQVSDALTVVEADGGDAE